MATPPNAIVFGSGRLRMFTMVQVGVVLKYGGRGVGVALGDVGVARVVGVGVMQRLGEV